MGFEGFWGFLGRSDSMPQPLGSPPASLAAVRRGAVGFTSTRGGTQLECVTGSVVCTIRRGQ